MITDIDEELIYWMEYNPKIKYPDDILLEFYFIDLDDFKKEHLYDSRYNEIIYHESKVTIIRGYPNHSNRNVTFHYHLSDSEKMNIELIKKEIFNYYNLYISICDTITWVMENSKIDKADSKIDNKIHNWGYLNHIAQNFREKVDILLEKCINN